MAEESSDDAEIVGPVFEVWNHLWSGVQMAEDELRVLAPSSRETLENVAKIIVDGRAAMVLDSDSVAAHLLRMDDVLLEWPWVRHAVELEIAERGVSRAETALSRYVRLRPAIAERPLPERALPYVREVIETFAFGFDAACIALCRAMLEQVLRDELVRREIYTEGRLRREQPSAGTLLENAKREGMLDSSYDAASQVVKKGDTVMHRHIYDAKILEQQALDSVADLLRALEELLA